MNLAEFLHMLAGCLEGVNLSQGLYAGLFIAGLVGGLTHCVAMCGPFVLAQDHTQDQGSDNNIHVEKSSPRLLLPYHIGRLTTYIILAVIFSGILNLAYLFLPIRSFIVAPLLMIAAVGFFVSAFQKLAQMFPWFPLVKMLLPYRWFSSAIKGLARNGSYLKQYGLGVVLGFMPCGLVISALLAASSAPSMGQAALAMAAFGVGTMPALIALSIGGGVLKRKFPIAMGRITQAMMVWSGLWLVALAGYLLV